jgi:hypothetical protein
LANRGEVENQTSILKKSEQKQKASYPSSSPPSMTLGAVVLPVVFVVAAVEFTVAPYTAFTLNKSTDK